MARTVRIIDNKKISLTDREWDAYVQICRSYDRPNCKGEELFKELFESDKTGTIVFIKPPSTRYTSFEIVVFMFAIYNAQQLDLMKAEVAKTMSELTEKVNGELARVKGNG